MGAYEMSIYQDMKLAGVPIDNHESDLYAKVTPESKAIVDKYEHKSNVRAFLAEDGSGAWFDIPLAYDPFWEAKRRTH